jgi:uncharacterized protein YggE
MRRYLFVGFVVLSVVLAAGQAMGRYSGTPNPENTITVTATGSVDADADWAEINLQMEGDGPTADDAMLACSDACERTIAALAKLGIAKNDTRMAMPQINGSVGADENGEPERCSVNTTLTVRINKVDAATICDDVCKIVDAAIAAEKGQGKHAAGMRDVTSGEAVVFGVRNPKPLRDTAISKALVATGELAEVAAAKAGKKLGPLLGIGIQSPDDAEEATLDAGTSGRPLQKAGRGTYSVSISATYKLQ